MATRRIKPAARGLPQRLRPFFWDYDFAVLTWQDDRDLVIGRILSVGHWDAVRWVRRRLGDAELRGWLERRRGAGLSRRQLRFWQLILKLPPCQVDDWLSDAERCSWDGRARS